MATKTKIERSSPLHVVVGCGEFKSKGWWNIDFHRSPDGTEHGTYPDEVVGDRAWGTFENIERLYLGHVLEHIPQELLMESLQGWLKACAPGAQVCVVGPEYNRALELYRRGELKLNDLWQRGEPGRHDSTVEHWRDYYERELWNHSFYHRWTCTTERAQALMELAGYQDVRPLDILSNELNSWPLVSRSHDQFALMCSAP